MDNENIMPLEEAYLIRKNQFQGIVTMPKEIKKKNYFARLATTNAYITSQTSIN